MDFLKKHYEKVILAVVSVLLIATAVILMGQLAIGPGGGPGDDDINRAAAPPVDADKLVQVSAMLQQPQQWTGKGPAPFIPGQWKYDPRTRELSPAEEKIEVIKKEDPLSELDWYVRFKTFPMEFKSVVSGEGTNATFQINIADDRSSRFVRIGSAWRQVISGYWEIFRVTKVEQKQVERLNPATRHIEKVDVSILTLLRRGTTEIPLILGQRRFESDPVARYESRATGERSVEMVKGVVFQYKGKRFKLLDITTRRLLIEVSESGAVREISPRGVSGQ
ncbi:MAG: hypothetical protein HZA91_01770 [Verrucomicrobia bacterium]|nr:hypothetical protein [Verrucomicrobiota bacterium]